MQARQQFPRDGNLLVPDHGNRWRIADKGADRLTPISDIAVGKNGLIFPGRINAKSILAEDIGSCQYFDEPGMGRMQGREITKGEVGVMVRRTDCSSLGQKSAP